MVSLIFIKGNDAVFLYYNHTHIVLYRWNKAIALRTVIDIKNVFAQMHNYCDKVSHHTDTCDWLDLQTSRRKNERNTEYSCVHIMWSELKCQDARHILGCFMWFFKKTDFIYKQFRAENGLYTICNNNNNTNKWKISQLSYNAYHILWFCPLFGPHWLFPTIKFDLQ